MPKLDIGLMWGKIVNIWGQLGTVAGIGNTIMMIFVFYQTTVQPNFKIPIYLYLSIVVVAGFLAVWFIIKCGISGYYRFFSGQTPLGKIEERLIETERRQKLIMKHFGIEDLPDEKPS